MEPLLLRRYGRSWCTCCRDYNVTSPRDKARRRRQAKRSKKETMWRRDYDGT